MMGKHFFVNKQLLVMNFKVAHLISRLRATHVAMEDKVSFAGLKLVLTYNEATNIYCELYGATQSYFIYTI